MAIVLVVLIVSSLISELSVSDFAELLSTEPSKKVCCANCALGWPIWDFQFQEYQQELFQLQDEFEKYKMRAQSVLKSRGNKVCH